MAISVLDDYYLGLTAIVTIGYQLFFFSIAYTIKFDKLTGETPNSDFPNIWPNSAFHLLYVASARFVYSHH